MNQKINMTTLSERFENDRNFPNLPTGKTTHPNGVVWYHNMNTQALFTHFCNGYMARMEDEIREKMISVNRMRRGMMNSKFMILAKQCIDVDYDHTEKFKSFDSMNTLDFHIIVNGLRLTHESNMNNDQFETYTNTLNL